MNIDQVTQRLQQFVSAMNRMGENLQSFIQSAERSAKVAAIYFEAVLSSIEHFARYSNFINAVKPTGWLPYHTVPMELVEEFGHDVSLLDTRLSAFYEANWDDIRQDIEIRLEHYHTSEEARVTFREALSAHDVGHFRCVCRVLFPEIDREFRRYFFQDSAGSISSRKMLEELESQGKLGTFLPREAYGWILFGRLIHHLYEPVNDDNRSKYVRDSVPNRHATLHGLVSYSTFKHSMNMIIMADYIFQVLTSISKQGPQQH